MTTENKLMTLIQKMNSQLINDYEELCDLVYSIEDKDASKTALRDWLLVHINGDMHALRQHLKSLMREVK